MRQRLVDVVAAAAAADADVVAVIGDAGADGADFLTLDNRLIEGGHHRGPTCVHCGPHRWRRRHLAVAPVV